MKISFSTFIISGTLFNWNGSTSFTNWNIPINIFTTLRSTVNKKQTFFSSFVLNSNGSAQWLFSLYLFFSSKKDFAYVIRLCHWTCFYAIIQKCLDGKVCIVWVYHQHNLIIFFIRFFPTKIHLLVRIIVHQW